MQTALPAFKIYSKLPFFNTIVGVSVSVCLYVVHDVAIYLSSSGPQLPNLLASHFISSRLVPSWCAVNVLLVDVVSKLYNVAYE